MVKTNYRKTGIIYLILTLLIFLFSSNIGKYILYKVLLYTQGISIDVNFAGLFGVFPIDLIIMILEILGYVYALVVFITIIKTNKYTKHLLYLFYYIIFYEIVLFSIGLYLKQISLINLISAGLIYFFFIYHDNATSKFVLNK